MKRKIITLLLVISIAPFVSAKLMIDDFIIGCSEGDALTAIEDSSKVTPIKRVQGGGFKIHSFNIKAEGNNLALVTVAIKGGELVAVSKVILIDGKGDATEFEKVQKKILKKMESWRDQFDEKTQDSVILKSSNFTAFSGYVLQAVGTPKGLKEILNLDK